MPAAEPDNEDEKDEQDETYTSCNAYGYNNSESQMKKGKDKKGLKNLPLGVENFERFWKNQRTPGGP